MVINARHELILIQARNDNCLMGDPTTLELFKVQANATRVIERDK